jgi:DNA-binding Lrp family transcriptional regulator
LAWQDYGMVTKSEKEIARYIQRDIPLAKRPFNAMGQELGTTERDILHSITQWKDRGIIRKFGAIVRHGRAGFAKNAMVIWAVPAARCREVGERLARFSDITHCYERVPPFEGKYTVFTMMHFRDENAEEIIRAISADIGVADYKVLTTEEEFKKSSMEYF